MANQDVKDLANHSESIFYDTRDLERRADSSSDKDDYGTRRVPADWRFSASSSAWSWMGLSTAIAYPLTGALLTLAFGAVSVMIAFLISMVLVGFGVYYSSKKSANEGIGKDLMSRSTYGYFGSVLNTLFVGIYLVILFSLETSVIAGSLNELLPSVPYWLLVLIIIGIFVPLGIYGMVWIAKLQTFTFVLYVVGIVLVFSGLFNGWSELTSSAFAGEWWRLNPNNVPTSWMTIIGATGAWMGAFGFMNIFASTDITRMTRRSEQKKIAVYQVIINSVINSFLIGAMGIFFLASSNGVNPDPGVTFVWVLGPLGLLLVFVTQLRGNVMNMYLGTLAFDNVLAQVTKKSYMRSWLLIPFVIMGFIMVVSSFLQYFSTIATFAGVVFAAWVGSTFGEALLVRPRYKIPKWSEFRRAYLPNINWIGFTSLIIPIIIGMMATLGVWGDELRASSVFVSLLLAFIFPVVLATVLGKEKTVQQYFKRIPVVPIVETDTLTCFVTGQTEHKSDFVLCPFHGDNWISSTTCATETKCNKMCQFKSAPNTIPVDQSV
jgi:cytosine permease